MNETPYLRFDKGGKEEAILLQWWNELKENRGDRAELRRCRTTTDVAFTRAFHRLLNRLSSFGAIKTDRLALVAGVLAHVDTHDPSADVASQMARPKNGDRASVSGLRFRRLLRIDDENELYQALVRMVHLLGKRVNILSLAQSAYWWNERTKKEWAFSYYKTAPTES